MLTGVPAIWFALIMLVSAESRHLDQATHLVSGDNENLLSRGSVAGHVELEDPM